MAHEEHEQIDEAFYEVEGIGYDFYPTVFDRKLIDRWIKSNDVDSFKLSRDLILNEGLLCGGSSGSAMASALIAAKDLNENQRCVVILPDGIRNYMSKFVNDEWMIQRNFEIIEDHSNDPSYYSLPLSKLEIDGQLKTVNGNQKVGDVLKLMNDNNLSEIPVVCSKNQSLLGMFTTHQAMKSILNKKLKFDDEVAKSLINDYPKVTAEEPIGKLCKLLNRFSYVALVNRKDHLEFIISLLTHSNILNFISKQ